MLSSASLITDAATGVGMLAGLIAVFGFLAQIGPTLAGWDERDTRKAAVLGGTAGFVLGSGVIVLSAGI